jgi:uncharacterized protein YegJ (DUF2314 family)
MLQNQIPNLLECQLQHLLAAILKRGFPEKDTNRIEHLWVEIKKIKNDDTLIGNISNDPTLNIELKDGDHVEIKVTEIEDLYKE